MPSTCRSSSAARSHPSPRAISRADRWRRHPQASGPCSKDQAQPPFDDGGRQPGPWGLPGAVHARGHGPATSGHTGGWPQANSTAPLPRTRRSAIRGIKKDEFLAMLGHELRNPLGAINTALQVIDKRGAEDSKRYHQVIDRQIKRLSRIVDGQDRHRAPPGGSHFNRASMDGELRLNGAGSSARRGITRVTGPGGRLRGPGAPGADLFEPSQQRLEVHPLERYRIRERR